MKNWLNLLLIDLAALLFGAMLSFAFAPYAVFPFAVVAPAGLLALWLNASPKRAFWLGFVFGLGLFGTGVYWVFHSIHVFGGVPSFPAGLITSGLIGVLALFPALVGYFCNRYFPFTNAKKLIFAFPAIWVFSEWLRSFIFSGFPWLLIGYSQTSSPLKGYAPVLGVYGVSLIVLMTSGLIVNGILQLRQKAYASVYLSLFAITCLWAAGGLLSFIPWTKPTGNPIPVSLVQGDIPQAVKWSPDHLRLSFDRYEKLTEPLWGKNKLIIWPEAAIPLSLQDAAGFIETMDEKARTSGSSLILGIPIQAADNAGYFNAVVTLGHEKQVYLKRRLVPFGEYVPFLELFPHLFNFMNIPLGNTIAGKVKQAPFVIDKVKILVSICYEIAFPELINTQDKMIGLLLTVSNDAWFGESSAQAQHLQMAEMRALELKRPVLFVSNNGITAIINPDGAIEASAPPRAVYVLNGTVQPTTGLTPWMYNGMDPLLVLLLGFIVAAVRENKRAAKQAEARTPIQSSSLKD